MNSFTFQHVKSRLQARRYLTKPWLLVYIALGIILSALALLTLALASGGWSGSWGPSLVQGYYLFLLGIVLAFATVTYATIERHRPDYRSGVVLAAAVIVGGFWFLSMVFAVADLMLKCNWEVSCNPSYAQATAFTLLMAGLVLASIAFVLGYEIALFRRARTEPP